MANQEPRYRVPVPLFRPGDEPDFSHLKIPAAGEAKKPGIDVAGRDTADLALGMVRVLDHNHQAVGEWNPEIKPDVLREGLRHMVLTRVYDERMLKLQRQGKMSFYMKSTGEEAVAVAGAMALKDSDMLFPSYRQQGMLFVRGRDIVDMMCHCISNSRDNLKGRQLPVHYTWAEGNFFSISGNLATQTPQAVGWAMASAIKGDSRIAATWVGEGSTAEGDFHSACTFATVYNAPVILNVINNQWAISSFSGFAGAERTTFAARALGYGLAGLRVDGNDALACFAAQQWAANRARANAGPTLIEYFTYRAEGHSTSDDPTGYRSAQERTEWPLGDPVMRLKRHLIAIGEWDEERQEKMDLEAAERVKAATKEAEKNGILGHGLHHPFRTMFEDVFEELPWHLREQSKQAIREREIKFPEGRPNA